MASMRSRTGRLVLIFGSCTERKRELHQYAPKLLLFGSRRVGGFFHFLAAPCGIFPHSSVGKESACNAGDPSLIPGSGRSAGEGKGYPLQYSGLENYMDCIVMGSQRVRQDWATFTFTFHVPCGNLVPWPGTELLLNMKYIRPGLGNATVWHTAFQTKCCFSRGCQYPGGSLCRGNPLSANRQAVIHSELWRHKTLLSLLGTCEYRQGEATECPHLSTVKSKHLIPRRSKSESILTKKQDAGHVQDARSPAQALCRGTNIFLKR